MRKVILVIILASCVYQLKAQQLSGSKLADSLTNQLKSNLLKSQLLNNNQLLHPDLNQTLLTANFTPVSINADVFYSHMPVAVLQGNSKMPVVDLKSSDDRMIKKIELNNSGDGNKNSFSIPPAFIVPSLPVVPVQKN